MSINSNLNSNITSFNMDNYKTALYDNSFKHLSEEVPPGNYLIVEQKNSRESVDEILASRELLNRAVKGSVVNVFDEGFYFLDVHNKDTGQGLEWLDFPFLYPKKELSFYQTLGNVGFSLKLHSNNFAIHSASLGNSVAEFSASGEVILTELINLPATAIEGGICFKNDGLYIGLSDV